MNSKTTRRNKIILAAFWMMAASKSLGATTLWEVDLSFTEFAGQAGGFEELETNFSYHEYRTKTSVGPAQARSYQVLQQTGTDAGTGRPLYAVGQSPGAPAFTVTTHVLQSEGNPWSMLRGGISNQGLSSQAQVTSGTSRPGEYGVVVYDFVFPAELDLDAKNLSVRLDSVNGGGEIYEWAFVTVNDRNFDNPGFDLAEFGNYKPNVYSNLANSSYLNLDGTVKAGGIATNAQLPPGRSITQFLAGLPGNPDSEGMVDVGWYAMDQFNVKVKDGAEGSLNPSNGTGNILNVFNVSGADLGLADDEKVTRLTIWKGYYDVAFDTNGDGFTRTGPNNQIGQVSGLRIGSTDFGPPVPEPSAAVLAGLMGFGLFLRRRR
jgi:hypothetical protein